MIQLPPFDLTPEDEQQPAYDYSITLDGTEYRITVQYRERQDRWYLSLYSAADEPIILGLKLMADRYLLAPYVMAALPPGDLLLLDTTGAGVQCGFDDLGRKH